MAKLGMTMNSAVCDFIKFFPLVISSGFHYTSRVQGKLIFCMPLPPNKVLAEWQ